MWFKKTCKCKHAYENLGIFYKEIFTQYRNWFDEINVYKRNRCKICGHIEDTLLSSEKFMPELYEGRDGRKDEYIKHLKNKGCKLEIDI